MSWFFSSLPYSFPSAEASAFTLFVFPLLSHPLLIRRALGEWDRYMDVFVIMTLRFPAEAPIQFSLNQAVTTNVSQRGSETQTMIGSERLKSVDRG
jgi:hypothetical protein